MLLLPLLLPFTACLDDARKTDPPHADTASDTAPDDSPAADSATDDPPPGAAPPEAGRLPPRVPTADAPFVVEDCGFDVGAGTPFVVPDRDGDGVDELVLTVDASTATADATAVAGVWLVPSTSADGPFWEQPLRWATVPVASGPGMRALADLDGDGLDELVSFEGSDRARPLLPDGSVGDALEGVPTALIPWRDLDGDGAVEHLGVFPEADALRIVRADGLDPSGWEVLATVSVPGLGPDVARAREDHDGDGVPELYAVSGRDGVLIGSAALERGEADAVWTTIPDVSGYSPVALGDVDGGGVEDVAFHDPDGGRVVYLARGEAPDAPVMVGDASDTWSAGIGPDGAGGLRLYRVDGDLSGYDLADALEGRLTRVIRGWSGRRVDRLHLSPNALWVTVWATEDQRYTTRTVAARLDPTTADASLAEVLGGGPGQGGQALGYRLDDLDGDGALDWWQDDEGPLVHARVTPDTTLTMCDAPALEHPEWSHASVADDLDADGLPELTYWDEPDTVGLWSPTLGERVSETYDGALRPLGCDLNGDGADELVLGTLREYVVDGAAWLAGDTRNAVLGEVENNPVCIGDLDGDGISEVGSVWTDLVIHDGASIAGGPAEVIAIVAGPVVGRPHALGDVDGDGLGDLAVYVQSDTRSATCLVRGANLLTHPLQSLDGLDTCWSSGSSYWRADLESDGVNEIVFPDDDGLYVWSPATDATARVWSPDDDARDEPLLGVVEDAFGPGWPAIVLCPEPVVVYEMERAPRDSGPSETPHGPAAEEPAPRPDPRRAA